jgi:hypothetical protein
MESLSMKTEEQITVLEASIQKSRSVLDRLADYYQEYREQEMDEKQPKRTDAIVIADILVNCYTCLETIFHRISQFFENNLRPDQWHRDLLEKMTLEVPGIRKAAISDKTYALLSELLKFRHFKRYYFELEYDWDKLDFLQKKFHQLQPEVAADLDAFLLFLDELREN